MEIRNSFGNQILGAAKKEFEIAIAKCVNQIDENYINVAQSLHEAVRMKDYGKIAAILDKMMLPRCTRFKVKECKPYGLGDESRLRLSWHSDSKDIFDYLSFDNSCMGAWQAYLLFTLWHSLPLHWHSNYYHRDYLYSKDDVKHIRLHYGSNDIVSKIYAYLDKNDIAPEIYSYKGKYYITCCYWTNFGGLHREYFEIIFNDSIYFDNCEGKHHDRISIIDCIVIKTLYDYHCHIRY